MSISAKLELPRSTPEQQGVSSGAVLRFVEALSSQINEVHSFMVLRYGVVIAEGWWSPYGGEHPHMMFSLSKSFTATAVGLAIAEGHLSLDDQVLPFFPDEAPTETNEHLAAMRVRHLLSMTTGQAADTWTPMTTRPDGKWLQGFFSVPVAYAPGTHFVYNTGATYVLSAIVQKVTGQTVLDYLTPRLFEPLGIQGARWTETPEGITAGGIGLIVKTEDIARFGLLYLHKGIWQGQQILPISWVEEATAFQVSNGTDERSDWAQGYGYQFWRCRHGAYRGDGAFGQFCVVMPEQDAVIALTGGIDVLGMQPPLDMLWEILLPAMHPTPLPDDPPAWEALRQRVASLGFSPAQGKATPEAAMRHLNKTYTFEANALGIETMAFVMTESGWQMNIQTARGVEVVPCGSGIWERGETGLFRHPVLFDRTPITASGEWRSDDEFSMVIRLYETPFLYAVKMHFMGEGVMVEAQINTSLDSIAPLLLTGYASPV